MWSLGPSMYAIKAFVSSYFKCFLFIVFCHSLARCASSLLYVFFFTVGLNSLDDIRLKISFYFFFLQLRYLPAM